MRLERLHGRHSSALSPSVLLQHAWKLGVGLLILAVVAMSRSVAPPAFHASSRHLATTSSGPTLIPCGTLAVDSTQTVTWNASGSPYILPWNDPLIQPTDTTHQPNCLNGANKGDDIHLAPGTTLVIDGSQGPVRIFSHGAGISADGAEIRTVNTDQTNFVAFDAEPDVASWDGIAIHASGASQLGDGAFSYVSIQHALTAISIDSGALKTLDPTVRDTDPQYPVYVSYGLAVVNSGIGPSYFDGIDSKNTPISVTGLGDGQYGTVNNIGSQGINVAFDTPPTFNHDALKVTGITFGSSVPFGETGCPPEPQQCANRVLGQIGNNALIASLPEHMTQPVLIDQNNFFRAGSFGVELVNADHPQITNNDFVCNGSGSPSPVTTCVASGGLQKFSAIYLENVSADLIRDPAKQPSPTPCPVPPTPLPPPPAFPVAPLATSGISNNVGQENGLDALVLSGTITSDVLWQTPFNDPNIPSGCNPPHDLGFMVGNVEGTGGIELQGTRLTVNDGDVVKVQGGGITLTGGSLKADSPKLKTFTSMRDNTIGIQACPSVFVQSCPAALPSNEWTGIQLSSGATGNINNANILFPTKGVNVKNAPATIAEPDGNLYGLVVTGSRIGPTFSDSVGASGTAAYVRDSFFCRVDTVALESDGVTPNPNYNKCSGSGPGDRGINADFTSVTSGKSLLTVLHNVIQGSTSEGILGTGLENVKVNVASNSIDQAGSYGIQLAGANSPTLQANTVTNSGLSTPTAPTSYPAIYLNGVTKAYFGNNALPPDSPLPDCTCIRWNAGSGNGLDAMAFHGTTGTDLIWMSPSNSTTPGLFGYILDDSLQVNGTLTLNPNDLVEIAHGKIMATGTLSATNALITSLKQGDHNLPAGFGAVNLPTCGSVFDPRFSTGCPDPAPGDWTGLMLDGQQANTLTGSTIRFARIGIEIDKPANQPLSLAQTNIQEVADTAIHSESYLVVNGGQFVNTKSSTGNGIWFDSGASISGTQIRNTGQEGIVGTSLNTDKTTGVPVVISGTSIAGAGTYGIRLMPAGQALAGNGLTITNNDVSNSGTGGGPYPAIYLGGVAAGVLLYPGEVAAPPSAVSIQGNTGNGNGLDALAFHGSVARNLTWLTANKNQLGQRLGYLLDGDLDLNGYMLTVNAGDVVKVGNGGTINMNGGRLKADDTSSSSQKIFTTLADNSAGVAACPSVFLAPGCSAATSYWGGINLPIGFGSLQSDATLVNGAIRYATTGISISSGATATFASSVYGLVVAGSTIGPFQLDGINSTNTAISVTNSRVDGKDVVRGTNAVHGISADLTNVQPGTSAPLRFSGNRFVSTGAEAILGQALAGQPVWISDNQVQQAGTFGIRLLNPDELVLRNNNVSGSGNGAGGPYPAIYLSGMTGDFARNIRGNVGANNALDAIAMHGTVQMDASVSRVMQWISPVNSGTTHQLGYVLDGSLTLQNSDLKVNPKGVVKVLSGAITINQGILTSGDKTSTDQAVFTSFKDNSVGPGLCPSIFISPCTPTPAAGDWGGLKINGLNPTSAESLVAKTTITYANTALAIDAGPFGVNDPAAVNNFRLEVSGSTITDASGDAINSVDTPIRVDSTVIGRTPTPVGVNIGGRGIIATFLGAANCSGSSCERLQLTNNTITRTGKDGIVANGLAGQPVDVEGNQVVYAGTYGIRLLGANLLTLTQNSVVWSGLASGTNPNYPAIFLNGVKADFETSPGTGSIVEGNHGNSNGLDALAFDGEATKNLSWLTPAASASDTPFGYLLDGPLTVDGTLTTKKSDVVKILNGGIKINPLNGVGGILDVPDTTTFTSLKDPDNGMAVCNSVFVTDACPSAAGMSDWYGINIDAGPSTFKNGHLLYATSGITINGASLDLNGALLTKLSGYAVHTTGTGSAVITCSSIHDNGGGILSEGAANATSIDSSDMYGNTSSGHDVVATVATRATNDWWGVDPPAASQYNFNGGNYVTFTPSLPQQAPTLLHGTGKISVSSENTKTATPASTANPYLGFGTLTVNLTFDRGMDTTQALTVNFAGSDNVVHPVAGAWASKTSWTGIATVDGSNHAGDNRVTVSGGKSCAPDGTRAMAPETSNTTDTPFYLDFGKASVAGTGGATNITPTAATLNDSVNPNGWSDPSSNPNTDTYVFFQTRLGSATSYAFDPLTTIVPGFDPTHLLGYQKIGHGNTAVNVSTTVGSLAAAPAGTTYDYRAVAVDLNGVRVGTDQLFTTAAQTALDHFTFAAIPGQTAGTAFTVTVTAYDATNTVIAGYTGASAVLTSNLSTAPTGSCAGSPAPTCQPSIGALSWVAGTGTANVTAYVAEANRTFTLTDGGVHANSAAFTVGNTGTAYQLGFTSTPQILAVNALSSTMTVQLQDKYSNPFDTTSPTGTTVNLSVAPLTAGSFLDSGGTTAITTVNMPLGSHAVQFTYKGTAAGSPILKASAAGVNDGTQTETVASQLVVKTAPQSGLTVGTASGAITIQLQDASGNPIVAGSDVIVTLALPTTDPSGHFRDSTNTANVSQVTISSGSSTGTFLYKPAASGSQTITVHVGGGIPDAQQTESVS